ncbi:MAG TPA: hypothetical protein VLH10_28055 [Yinghuangia sp.]|uniref:hypothetical protein n=1 Tax=Yinghuangia sp. YIM S10712 TaxID=3436930 RepID=UPI002B9E383B|nr:hypothetical protein [Yinghuangia sp.]
MIDDVDSIPRWPVIAIRLDGDGSVTVDGEPLALAPGEDARTVAMERARHTADLLGRPVRVDAREPDGTVFPMVIDGTGDVAEAGPPVVPGPQRRGLLRRRSAPAQAEAGAAPLPPPAPARADEVSPAGAFTAPPVPVPPVVSDPPGTGVAPPYAAARQVPRPANDFGEAVSGFGSAAPSPGHGGQALPRPTEEQARVLARVRRAAEAGDPRGALAEIREIARDAEGGAAAALGEVEAYLTFLDGDPVKASRLYLGLASDPDRRISDTWALGLVECAHHCWLDVDDVGPAYELGRELVAAYTRLGAADSVQIAHARARLREMRARLAIT